MPREYSLENTRNIGIMAGGLHPLPVPQDDVHGIAVYNQPPAAVDPPAPSAFRADEAVPAPVVQPGRNGIVLGKIRLVPIIIQANVDIRPFRCAARSP